MNDQQKISTSKFLEYVPLIEHPKLTVLFTHIAWCIPVDWGNELVLASELPDDSIAWLYTRLNLIMYGGAQVVLFSPIRKAEDQERIRNNKSIKNWNYALHRLAEEEEEDGGNRWNRDYFDVFRIESCEGGVIFRAKIANSRLALCRVSNGLYRYD
jgi:hypothetical protein